jgi:hypothetical protein
MSCSVAQRITDSAQSLRRSHPHAPVRDVLDLVMQSYHGQRVDFGDVSPVSPLGLLVVAAFDKAMTPADWQTMMSVAADPLLRSALLTVWRSAVWPQFVERYGLK